MAASERKIVVELIQSADVSRLEARDDDLRNEIKQLEARIDGLHRTIYDLMNALSNIKHSK